MGVIHKDVVQYTWTALDQLITQAWPKHLVEGARGEDRYVTPYRILPSSLPDGKKWNDIPKDMTENEFCKRFNCQKAQRVVIRFNME